MNRVVYLTLGILAFAGSLMLACSAQSAPYYLVSISSDGNGAVLVDRGSVRRARNIASVWVAVADKQPNTLDLDANSRRVWQNGIYFISYESYDCARSQWSTLYGTGYARDGSSLGEFNDEGNWKPVVPDSMRAESLRVVCSSDFDEQYRVEPGITMHRVMQTFLND